MSSLIPHCSVVPTWQAATRIHLESSIAVVIDVLRWSTVVVTALSNGAERVEAFATPDQALERAEKLGRAQSLLGGERNNRPLNGFDVGNSPLEYSPNRVAGKTVVTSTTNGTSALVAAAPAAKIFVAAFVNLSATIAVLEAELKEGKSLTLICSGQAGAETLEDTACAGAMVDALMMSHALSAADLDAGAIRARDAWLLHDRSPSQVMQNSRHAHALRNDGFEGDVLVAGELNRSPVVVSSGHTAGHTEGPRSIVMYHT